MAYVGAQVCHTFLQKHISFRTQKTGLLLWQATLVPRESVPAVFFVKGEYHVLNSNTKFVL